MRWFARLTVVCALLACTFVVLADERQEPTTTERTQPAKTVFKSPDQLRSVQQATPASSQSDSATLVRSGRGATSEATSVDIQRDAHHHGMSWHTTNTSRVSRQDNLLDLQSTAKSKGERGEYCGDPEAGSCFEANGSSHCDDEECCDTVCYEMEMESCCTDTWDEECADMAQEVCGGGGEEGGCGDPESGNCCESNGTPYCDNAACCDAICYDYGLTSCCTDEWNEECASMAEMFCDNACGPSTSACCFGDQCADLDEVTCILNGGQFFGGYNCGDEGFFCAGCSEEDSLYSQSVVGWGSYFSGTSDLSTSSRRYDRFSNVEGDICGVKWVGTSQNVDGWDCFEDPMTFEISFYRDNGYAQPGTQVSSHTATVSGTMFGEFVSGWVEYEVQFDTCVTLSEGFISIASTGGSDCLFVWIEGADGDGSNCYWNSEEEEYVCLPPDEYWAFDFNFCLLGTPYPGACCDEVTGTCNDEVEAADCDGRFAPGKTCAQMDPTCGALAGACCIDEDPYCYISAETDCEGTYLGNGTICDTTDCNSNGIPDSCDIASGNSADCNNNGIPDECDITTGLDDYDGNGVLDICEPDCNNNGVVDACDLDCEAGICNTHPNGCGASIDCQPNTVPDECELGTLGSPVLWDGGTYNHIQLLRSHFGGQYADALTVDDFQLNDDSVINSVIWEAEESENFEWTGAAHLFIYGDNGENGPDDGNEILYLEIPEDGGTIFRTTIDDGTFLETRYRYEVYGLNIPLDAGIYWLGLAPDGGSMDYDGGASSKWCASQSGESILGGEAHMRVPYVGLDFFQPWTDVALEAAFDAVFTLKTTTVGADCDANGIPDDCDIATCDGSAWCLDCQGNGLLDGCEEDCNANDVADQCDILYCDGETWCGDCDRNEIPDQCQVPPLGEETDCNGNGSPDSCDVANGVSPDCNGNLIPDECDIASGFSWDYDENTVPDECDPDCNANGVVDRCDMNCSNGSCLTHPDGCGASLDCQFDEIPDECQLAVPTEYVADDGASDNSVGITQGGSIAILNEFAVQDDITSITGVSIAWGNVAAGTPFTAYLWSDPNNDGSPADAVVLASVSGTVADPNTDTFQTLEFAETYIGPNGTTFFAGYIISQAAGEHPAALDSSGDGVGWIAASASSAVDPNALAYASNPVQLYAEAWMIRAVGPRSNDCNATGIPDECDISSGASADCDANGVPDECEWTDCNDNGVHDPCDLLTCDGSTWCSDCNFNNLIDECDISSGHSDDCQPDSIPDECQTGNSVPVLDETFYSETWNHSQLPTGWEVVNVSGSEEIQWVVTGSWGCDYEGGAAVYGNVDPEEEEGEDDEEDKSRSYFDVYMLSPEMTVRNGTISFCSTGCGYGSRDWCDNTDLDVMIIVGDIGGEDDVLLGSVSELWTGYISAFIEPQFDLTGMVPDTEPYRIAFRYYGDDSKFDSALIDQVVISKTYPGSDCDGNTVPDFCDLRDCDGSAWCEDCNADEVLDTCQTGMPGGITYQADDGSSNTLLGTGDYHEFAWLQGFDAVEGSETIISVSAGFGLPSDPGNSGVTAGDTFRVFVWEDPSDSGDPTNAVLLASATASVKQSSIDSDVLQEVFINPPVTVDGSFFIGVSVWSDMYPAPIDTDSGDSERAFITLGDTIKGGFNPNFIMWADSLDAIGYAPASWLLRAGSKPGPASNDCNGNGIPDECDLCGDFDDDGDVDYYDYEVFLEAFGGEADGLPALDYCCDYDNSGAVGMADFAVWLECYRDYVGDPEANPPSKPEIDRPRRFTPVDGSRIGTPTHSATQSLQSTSRTFKK